MTDQIHTVDGSTEAGREGTDPAAGEPAESVESALATVLQFPRDWFGPIEDLEPVHLDPATVSPVSAAAFWDEDAGAVHQLVELPDGEAPYDDEGLPAGAAERRSVPSRPGQRVAEGEAKASSGLRNRPVGLVLLGLLVLVVGVCAAVLASGTLNHRTAGSTLTRSRTRHKSVSQSPAPTVTAPAVTVTTTVTTVTTARKSRTPRRKPTHTVASGDSAKSVKSVSSPEAEQPVATHTEAAASHTEAAATNTKAPATHTKAPVNHAGASARNTKAPVTHTKAPAPNTKAPATRHPSETPASGARSSSGSGSVGSSCVQSPDSGCLP